MNLKTEFKKVYRQWAKTPPNYTGGLLINRLGLQVFRVAQKHLAWKMRRSRSSPEIRDSLLSLLNEGFVELPNFFPDEEFLRLRKEFEKTRKQGRNQYQSNTFGNLTAETLLIEEDSTICPAFAKSILGNSFIRDFARAALRRPINIPLTTYIEVVRAAEDPELDLQDKNFVLHSDRCFPTLRALFYIHDVTEDNGAFVYAPRTHKISIGRLQHEYNFSIRVAMMKNGKEDCIPKHLLQIGRNRISPYHMKKIGVREKAMCGKANTLLLVNNFGFHRRGAFLPGAEREVAWIIFHYLEGRYNRYLPALEAARLRPR